MSTQTVSPGQDHVPQGTAEFTPLLGADFLTVETLAKELGVSARTIARWHVERVGPPRITIHRTVLYRRASVREWLAAREERRFRGKR